MYRKVSKEELEYIAELFAKIIEENTGNTPIYRIKDMGKLESSLTQPFQEIAGCELYPSLVSKAVMLYYFCIKNHPFEDGNKRMGIFSMFLFLYKNGYWLDISPEELFDITVYTAASKVEEMDSVVNRLEKIVKSNLTKISS